MRLLQSPDDDARDDQVSEPIVIGRDDIPRSEIRARLFQGCFKGFDVVWPKVSLMQIVDTELPPLCWVLETILQTFLLLLLADVQEELHDNGAVFGQQLLKVIDVLVALFPHVRGDELVNALHQDRFVVASIEDHHLTLARYLLVRAPKKVTVLLIWGGDLEACHPRALRVDALEDPSDGAILATGVQGLEDNEY